ncbi:MAG: DUF2085 domain-containing protein [Anaerolineae bacterium]|nr:DUF2085 domain-containing protein [Anaerolineae bacterium]
MSELIQSFPTPTISQTIGAWANKWMLWLAKHWLAAANTFFFLYVGLPFLAPLLLANGQAGGANFIYWWYHLLCHSLPSRTYFIAGEQVCLCHRCMAIYGTIFVGGVFFGLVRHRLKSLPPKWYALFVLPMALDGGMGLASELAQFVPITILSIVGLAVVGLVGLLLLSQKQLTWPVAVFLGCGVLALGYLQFIGPHQSNLFLRNFTGFAFGLGTVWVAYPLLQEGFDDIRQETSAQLTSIMKK